MDRKKVMLFGGLGLLGLSLVLFYVSQVGYKAVASRPVVVASAQPARELVTDLPEDGQAWYTVLCYNDYKGWTNAQDRKLASMFAGNSRLRALQAQTFVKNYDRTDKLFVERYASQMGGQLPQVWVLRQDGKVAYKASGANIPQDANVLADQIAAGIDGCCPRPFKPKPAPPVTPVTPDNKPPVIPDTVPVLPPSEVVADKPNVPLLLAIFGFLGGVGLLIGYAFQNRATDLTT